MTTTVIVNDCTAAPPYSIGVRWKTDDPVFPNTWNFSYKDFAEYLPRPLDDDEQDWIEVFGALYAVDRVAIRPSEWSRDIVAHIPVRDPEKWNRHSSALRDVWNRLTGDRLQATFHQAANPIPPFRTTRDCPEGVTGTALFSGGLDSFAAVAELCSDGEKPALVTHMANTPVRTAVSELLKLLPDVPRPAPLPVISRNGTNSGIRTDESQRARSLLFIASAVVASRTFDVSPVWVGENGILAVHEPETEARVPSLSTRTAHPQVLAALQELAGVVLGTQPLVTNPLEHLTKAGVVTLIKSLGLSSGVERAVSCWKISRDPEHCGYCIPCLQRYVATSVAGVPDEVYGHSPWDAELTSPHSKADELDNLVHFLTLAQQVTSASDSEMEFRHPGLLGVEGALTDSQRLELHRTWASEVLQVAKLHPRSSALL